MGNQRANNVTEEFGEIYALVQNVTDVFDNEIKILQLEALKLMIFNIIIHYVWLLLVKELVDRIGLNYYCLLVVNITKIGKLVRKI